MTTEYKIYLMDLLLIRIRTCIFPAHVKAEAKADAIHYARFLGIALEEPAAVGVAAVMTSEIVPGWMKINGKWIELGYAPDLGENRE